MVTASIFAAYPQAVQAANVSSPASADARNSSDAEPPIAPDIAATMVYVRPSRSKIRWYAARIVP